MKKNAVLKFLFAFVPGAGQMYQGYMKRGLSLISLFILCVIAGSVINVLWSTCLIVWMYSFFDTFNLSAQIAAGTAPADAHLVRLELYDGKMSRLFSESHRLLGWALITLGAMAAYENIFMKLLDDLVWRSEAMNSSALLRALYLVCDQLPVVFVCVVLTVCGAWLLRSPRGVEFFAPQKPAIDDRQHEHSAANEAPETPAETAPEAPAEAVTEAAAEPAAAEAEPEENRTEAQAVLCIEPENGQ